MQIDLSCFAPLLKNHLLKLEDKIIFVGANILKLSGNQSIA